MPLSIRIMRAVNYKDRRLAKLRESTLLLQQVMNSYEFRACVYNHTTPFGRNFLYTNVSNEEVFRRIMLGAELLFPEPNQIADMFFFLLHENSPSANIVSFVRPGDPHIYTYLDRFDAFQHFEICAFMAHEWCHQLGFMHPEPATADSIYSVPYAVGDCVRNLSYPYYMNLRSHMNGGVT